MYGMIRPLKLSFVCNLACRFCLQTKRKPEFMRIDTFSQILDEIKPYTEYIYYHVKGIFIIKMWL